jgi:3-oxoacyl-[acyl-carrier-protein] synthase II
VSGDGQEARVVVTGMGTINPIGASLDEYWDNLIEGKSGLAIATSFDPTGLESKVVAEIPGFDPTVFLEAKDARRMARFTQMGIGASQLALQDAGLQLEREDRTRIGVELGTGIGGFRELTDEVISFQRRGEKGPDRISPFFTPKIIPNMAAGQIAIQFGLKGPNNTDVTACAASTQALGNAFRVLARGDADVMLAGGTEANICRFGVACFAAMRVLSKVADDPPKASRPFDKERDGFVPGEGAGILILETLDHARDRGARIYAEVAGFCVTDDAYHIVMPEEGGGGAARAMQGALDDARMGPGDIDYINAHGTSTQLNDRSETLAIKSVFGERAARIPISSTKSMIGHLLGAAGAVEAIAAILSMTRGWIHPTINLEHPDPDCDLDYVPNQARRVAVDVALSNSFGFGGQNACIVLKKCDG